MQDFVHLVIRTAAHLEMRWNELSVQSLMWQVFIPNQNFYSFTGGLLLWPVACTALESGFLAARLLHGPRGLAPCRHMLPLRHDD